ncbi:hypothetical protein SAMN05216223_101315 [Actinacidiphila yanglinensis]|uniref:Uncharacterized protein n=1 Tax=Actinacidiphila yanglinensis TaxID=310779 RepID=A0A1H5SZQ2_9ACTN|nr:hypothetical protein SAMN05216223_101315 [Actinacidiphila yanglinensis]
MDEVFARVRRAVPGVALARLAVPHAADDDNVYFLGDASAPDRVRLDTWPHGRPPFLIEADERRTTSDVDEAVAVVLAWLGAAQPGDGEARWTRPGPDGARSRGT